MGAIIDDVFCAHASKGITHCGRAAGCAREVNGCFLNVISRSEWKDVFEKEGNAKTNKICLTSASAGNL